MKGYSKIKIIHSPSHSRSMDISDQLTSLEQHTNSKKTDDEEAPEFQESGNNEGRKIKNHKKSKNNEDDSFVGYNKELDEKESKEISNEEIWTSRPKLKRNSSVSSASTLHSAVKKAFSMRRSTSVSDRYCRIHDQSSTLPSPTHHHHQHGDADADADADGFVNKSRSIKKKHTRGRILKACKKLIGM